MFVNFKEVVVEVNGQPNRLIYRNFFAYNSLNLIPLFLSITHCILLMKPKGKLIAIGGAEDKGTTLEVGETHRQNLNFFELAILRRIIEEAGGSKSRIEIISTASMIPYEVGNNYLNAF